MNTQCDYCMEETTTGNPIEEGFVTLATGETACEKCVGEHCFHCDFCEETWDHAYHGLEHTTRRYVRTLDGSYGMETTTKQVCEGCLEEFFVDCRDCSDTVLIESAHSVGGWRGNDHLCEGCMESYYHCEACESLVHCEDARYDEYGDATYCADCFSEYGSQSLDSETMSVCRSCDTYNTHLDTDTEKYLCDCKATWAEAAGHDVLRAGSTPSTKVPVTVTAKAA